MKSSRSWGILEELETLCRIGRLPQALLLEAPPEDFSEIRTRLARQVLCEEQGSDQCQCRSCLTPLEVHPDFVELVPAPRLIPRDAVRGAVQRLAAGPVWSPAKLTVINPADALGREAQGFLLKHLEEPPAFARYLLLTGVPDKVIPTIVSRCQHWQVAVADEPAKAEAVDPRAWRTEAVTLERIVVACRYARQAYAKTEDARWLTFWQTLEDGAAELEANGNEELVRSRIVSAWPDLPER